jgi:hypothetical protein
MPNRFARPIRPLGGYLIVLGHRGWRRQRRWWRGRPRAALLSSDELDRATPIGRAGVRRFALRGLGRSHCRWRTAVLRPRAPGERWMWPPRRRVWWACARLSSGKGVFDEGIAPRMAIGRNSMLRQAVPTEPAVRRAWVCRLRGTSWWRTAHGLADFVAILSLGRPVPPISRPVIRLNLERVLYRPRLNGEWSGCLIPWRCPRADRRGLLARAHKDRTKELKDIFFRTLGAGFGLAPAKRLLDTGIVFKRKAVAVGVRGRLKGRAGA